LGLGAKWMTNLGESTSAPLDVLSVVLSAFAFGGIVYGLSRFGGAEAGGPGSTIMMIGGAAIGAGLVFLGVFILPPLALQRHGRALLDLRVFLSRNYVLAVVIM